MMQRLRLVDVISEVAEALGIAEADPKLLNRINAAQQSLMQKVPIYFRYRVNATSNCLSWPRELETIEKVAICGTPRPTRDIWYEFVESGPGILDSACGCGAQLIDAEEAPAANDVLGDDKKLALLADSATDVGVEVILRYYSAGEKVLSTTGEEGETLTLVAQPGYATSAYVCDEYGHYSVIKPVTAGRVRLYEYDTVELTYRLLSIYEPDEEIPVYRRSKIPGLIAADAEAGTEVQVDVIGLPKFRKARNDNDFLFVNSENAVILACMALSKERANLPAEAVAYWQMAEQACREGVNYQRGKGAIRPVNIVGADTWGAAIPEVH